jgi:ABC-type transport system involved in multi-copper enzyme maturation permease subunit
MLFGFLLLALPGLIGVFWGAPTVARELEAKTDRLVWNQSVTRNRWLAVKLLLGGAAAVAVTGVFSLLLTWSASKWDLYAGDRFASLTFAARNVVPLGYAAFAFVLGVVVGLLVRRTVPAMAIVAAVFAVVQVVVPLAVRSHLLPPVTATVQFDADTMDRSDGFGVNDKGARLEDYIMPGTWPMQSETEVYNADGSPYTAEQTSKCMGGGSPQKDSECLAGKNLHFSYSYQPGNRYWPFQWIELGGYLALAVLLSGFASWWIRRRAD